MIEPKEILLDGRAYILTKFPAIAGREIVAGYPLTGMPKFGEYKANEEIMLKLMAFVGVPMPGGAAPQFLTARALVDNHVPNWELLMKIEWAMMQYNCSFFQNGRVSTFFEDIAQKLPAWILKILMDLSGRSLQTEKRRSKS